MRPSEVVHNERNVHQVKRNGALNKNNNHDEAIRETLPTRVARAVRSDIMSGVHPPGHRLLEGDLAKRYCVGRHVVREALQVLVGERLVLNNIHGADLPGINGGGLGGL